MSKNEENEKLYLEQTKVFNDEITGYINSTWKNIKNNWNDIKAKKFEDVYLNNIKPRTIAISEASNKLEKRLKSLEKYVYDNIY